MILDSWQKEVKEVFEKEKCNIAVRSGRQAGKSTVISVIAGDYAVKHPNRTVMVIASVERQAFLLFEKILMYMEVNYANKIKKGKDRPTKTRIKLNNGTVIHCLPTGLSGAGIRGFTIDLLIADEAAFIPNDVFTAVTPALAARASKGARIILLSTPFGRSGYFAESFKDSTFKCFHVSSEECPRISKEYLAQMKERMSKREYAQEFLGEFVDELMQFFPDDLIKKCMVLQREKGISRGKDYYLGVDIARMGEDESTFQVLELTGDKKLRHLENQITKQTYLNETTKHIIEMDKIYDFNKIFIDDEGIGVGVFDYLLENDQTKRKVIPINNSKRIIDSDKSHTTRLLKEDLYSNLLTLMERGDIKLLDDPNVFQSLKSVQFDYTSNSLGKPMLKIFGKYTHIAEGLIRAAWCVKYKTLNIWVKSIRV